MNPKEATGQFINTLNTLIEPVYKQYPNKLKFIRQEGTSEEAQLWEVQY
jgi:hypothetical protein